MVKIADNKYGFRGNGTLGSIPAPCSLRQMEKHELWWVAGVLEGEGSFISTYIRGRYWLCIQVRNTDRSLLEALQDVTGVGTVTRPIKPDKRAKPHWLPQYAWVVRRINDAKPLMEMLHPIMSQKRQAQIERSLAVFETQSKVA